PGNAAAVMKALEAVAKDSKKPLARLHAIWGMRVLRSDAALLAAEKCLFELVRDRDPEVRANAIKLLGDWHPFSTTIPHPSTDTAREGARKLLADPEPRVRYFAALAYGHIGPVPQAITPGSEQAFFAPLFDLLKSNNDADS